jgi:type IV pilus assembly protein PilC
MCKVATSAGEVLLRSYVADDERALRRTLEGQDLMVLDLRRRNALAQTVGGLAKLRGAVSMREFLIFNQELAALLRAGLPIIGSLEILTERRKNQTFKRALLDIRERVKSGESLSDGFRAQGDMFPSLYAASLASGERSGELVSVLTRFIDYMTKVVAIRSKVVSALIYPCILFGLSMGLVALMLFYIIPKFSEFLAEFGTDFPIVTQIVMAVAMFCQEHWEIITVSLITAVISYTFWARTERGRLAVDGMKLRLPIVGGVIDNYCQNRFTRTLGTLQAGGIPLVTSIELSARAVGNMVVERALLKVAEQVREGEALWDSLSSTGLISDITVQMVKVGESTGELAEMLHNASDFTDNEIDTALTRLVAVIEPVMLVFMALLVATMLMSIYLPMFQIAGQGTF